MEPTTFILIALVWSTPTAGSAGLFMDGFATLEKCERARPGASSALSLDGRVQFICASSPAIHAEAQKGKADDR